MLNGPFFYLSHQFPCAQLLASQVLVILLYPYLQGSLPGHVVLEALHIAVILMVVRAVGHTPGRQHVAATLAAFAVVAQLIYLATGWPDARVPMYLTLGLFQAYAVSCLFRYVIGDAVATTDELFAAAAMYILLAMVWSCAYAILEQLQPGAFYVNPANNPDNTVDWWDLIYYSFTTLTSVGFGEITPVTHHARSLVILEQVAGILFVAILIARLTGIYGGDGPARR
jgi:hypothetical protein